MCACVCLAQQSLTSGSFFQLCFFYSHVTENVRPHCSVPCGEVGIKTRETDHRNVCMERGMSDWGDGGRVEGASTLCGMVQFRLVVSIVWSRGELPPQTVFISSTSPFPEPPVALNAFAPTLPDSPLVFGYRGDKR